MLHLSVKLLLVHLYCSSANVNYRCLEPSSGPWPLLMSRPILVSVR